MHNSLPVTVLALALCTLVPTGARAADTAALVVSATATPNPVTLGAVLTYSIQVLNQGPAAAADVSLHEALSPGTTVISSRASQGTCTGTAPTITCALGTLAVNAVATVTIAVIPGTPGVIENTAIAEGTPAGPRPAEHVARIRTSVLTPPDVLLTVSTLGSGTGTVQSSPGMTCTSNCTAAYPFGTQVTLTAAGSDGAVFAGWSGDCAGIGICTVTLTRASTVTARFTPAPTVPLSITLTGTGTGSVSSSWPQAQACQQACAQAYPPGTLVSLTATPGSGSAFAGWSGACTGTGPCTLTVTGPVALTATFIASPTNPVRAPAKLTP
jgi:uncharacterized repeat protein (TIGR01451 family)